MTPAAQMHIQQTKAESRATGGPQYYLHGWPSHVKAFLRARGACPVLLQTPYESRAVHLLRWGAITSFPVARLWRGEWGMIAFKAINPSGKPSGIGMA